MARDAYDSLAKAVGAAGFYTTGTEDKGGWDRIVVCAARMPGGGYCGNSFWVASLPSGWRLGAWGGAIYRLRDDRRLAELCIDWLSRTPGAARSDFDDQLKQKFALTPVSHESFDAETSGSEAP